VYLRHSTIRKNGKAHVYWRLVRSVRKGTRVHQETVAQLGELDSVGRLEARALARRITGKEWGRDLFEPDEPLETVRVKFKKLRLERARRFGDVWLGHLLWQAVGLDELCGRLIPEGLEDVPWTKMAAVQVIARLCEPSSDLHIAEDWYRRTALDDLLGVPEEKVNEQRVYRVLDQLLPHKAEMEKHLKERLGGLFSLSYDLMLYDVTSTYFEGEAEGNEMAKRGHSRDKRSDCKQVCIALVVSREGVPVGYEVFDGNRHDSTTVEEIVEAMEAKYGKSGRVWVMDRGMTSEDNLEWLREGQRRYLVGTPKSELKQHEKALVDKADWKEVREGLEVKLCPGPEGEEAFVLCRSRERQEKEKAMHQRFEARIEKALVKLENRLTNAKKPVKPSKVERQIGRLLERNSRAAGLFQIEVLEDPSRGSRLKAQWKKDPTWAEWASLSEGCYILRTNVTDWTPEELWRTYIQLTQAEAAFQIHKSDLEIRPIWHHSADRVKAHILVCFLAYVLWKTLELWQSRAGLGNSPRTILEELGRIQSTDVVLPTVDGRELRLRCVVQPDQAQAILIDRLGLVLPKRLRMPETVLKM
jgi:transposase